MIQAPQFSHSTQPLSHGVTSQKKAAFLIAVFGSIPLFVGKRLRQLVYRHLLGCLGTNVAIAPGVNLICAQAIEIGNCVNIFNHVLLSCWEPSKSTSRLVIRDDATLDQGIHIQALGGTIDIGERTYVGPYVCMAGPGGIKIGRDCLIASHCGIYANNHLFDGLDRPINQQGTRYEGISIEDDCWLGCGVRVMDGVTIGRSSVIGAGAVVTKNVPPYSVAVGVPAKVISIRRESTSGKQQVLEASVTNSQAVPQRTGKNRR